ncbi:MAG: hypothetical protein CMJ50_06790 [Planctomycetaceae bacterium]|jgi:hypothetical protein|nr:hypothetical protein [Planctomycetaceae bacterium]
MSSLGVGSVSFCPAGVSRFGWFHLLQLLEPPEAFFLLMPPKSLAQICKLLKSVTTVTTAPESGPLRHGLGESDLLIHIMG